MQKALIEQEQQIVELRLFKNVEELEQVSGIGPAAAAGHPGAGPGLCAMRREQPIVFGAESVRALIEGRKTQTRRVVKLPRTSPGLDLSNPNKPWKVMDGAIFIETGWRSCWVVQCPYGSPRERLWVRETWREQTADQINYRADGEVEGARWRSPIFMPRWASRITLEITDVRVERLQQISDEDVAAEGSDSRNAFAVYWDALNTKRGHPWASNPWVWVLEFRQLNVPATLT